MPDIGVKMEVGLTVNSEIKIFRATRKKKGQYPRLIRNTLLRQSKVSTKKENEYIVTIKEEKRSCIFRHQIRNNIKFI